MTKKERAAPQILQASRKKRIAKGAGLEVQELNRLLKMHRQMADMMKKMGKKGMLKKMMGSMFGKGGAPEMAGLEAAAAQQAGQMPRGMQMPKGMGGMPGGGMGLPPDLSGFGKKK